MTEQIELLLKQRVLEVPDQSTLGSSFISKMFLTKKSDGSNRPIFNLKRLNEHIVPKPFKLISHHQVPNFLQKDDWMVKLDLSSAYFHLSIRECHRRFLRLFYRGQVLQMTSLPFGLSCAPKNFATLTNWVVQVLRDKGLRAIVYLDDFLFASQTKSQLQEQSEIAISVLESLGWTINYAKSVLKPTQEIEYLGIVWNTNRNFKRLPVKKTRSIKFSVSQALAKKKLSLKDTQIILGMMNFANFVIPRGRLHCRQLQLHARTLFNLPPTKPESITASVVADLQRWSDTLENPQVKSALHPKVSSHFLTTDAAVFGWGAQMDDLMTSGEWRPDQLNWHCNRKEMFAIVAAVSRYARQLQGKHLVLQTDNRTVVSYIRKEGGTRSIALLNLTYQLMRVLDKKENISITAEYLPGRFNDIADGLSRGKKASEWHLKQTALKKVFRRFGTPQIDLFATNQSRAVKDYVSKDCLDLSATFCNAFSRVWNHQLAWVFPPPSLIPRVLHHLNSAQGTFLLVAPMWDRAFWLPDLRRRALSKPMRIMDMEQVLIDQTTGVPPPRVQEMQLFVWKIGAGAKKPKPGRNQKEPC